jgi:hypothetical protein
MIAIVLWLLMKLKIHGDVRMVTADWAANS